MPFLFDVFWIDNRQTVCVHNREVLEIRLKPIEGAPPPESPKSQKETPVHQRKIRLPPESTQPGNLPMSILQTMCALD